MQDAKQDPWPLVTLAREWVSFMDSWWLVLDPWAGHAGMIGRYFNDGCSLSTSGWVRFPRQGIWGKHFGLRRGLFQHFDDRLSGDSH